MMELLSPAGDKEALIAAIQNGADAVYLGGKALNARQGAGNFDENGLLWASEYCHERGRKLYVTVNTLVKQGELALLHEIASQLARAGVDAAIVSDIGAAAALSSMLPGLALHASTQMAVHNRHGVRFLVQAGFKRVVLAREMRYEEIADCAAEGLPLEVFCHGALCVSCSGQCLFSSLVGGRSGNRGMCAQPCRLPYELNGGALRVSGYLLSPRDLMQLGDLPRLEQAGVHSLKIEGRLKRPEYVAIATRIYRQALDHPQEPIERQIDALKQIFNRGGFTRGYGPGLIDAELIYDERPNHAGLEVGELVLGGRVKLRLRVRMADSLTLDGAPVKLCGEAGETIRVITNAKPGAKLIRLTDDEQLNEARRSYTCVETPSVGLTGEAVITVDEPMRLRVSDGEIEVEQLGAVVERLKKGGADCERVRAQLTKTGGTPYRFDALDIHLDESAFAPASALNELRRAALEALRLRRIEARRGCGARLSALDAPVNPPVHMDKPRLSVQSGDLELLRAARGWGADELVFAPNDITLEALGAIKPDFSFRLALPMNCPDADLLELNRWAWARKEQLCGVLAANASHLALDWPGEMGADYPMNVANNFTVDALNKAGCRRYAPSVELTAQETNDLGGERELIVYGRLPLMVLRHCPLCARLSSAPHSSCNRCDAQGATIQDHVLTDRKGVCFPLRRIKTGQGCIVQLLNSVPMLLLRHTSRLPQAGGWRLLLRDEPMGMAEAVVRLHRLALDGKDYRRSIYWAMLDGMNTTTGHYFRGVE